LFRKINKDSSNNHNVLINRLTTFQDYWNAVKDGIKSNFGEGYGVTIIPLFKVRVWNGIIMSALGPKV